MSKYKVTYVILKDKNVNKKTYFLLIYRIEQIGFLHFVKSEHVSEIGIGMEPAD